MEGRDAFVCETEDAFVGAEPEAHFVCPYGEAVDADGDEICGRGCGAEFVLADFQIVVGFYPKFVRKEGAVVDCAAGFDDEVFEKKVDFRYGNFDTGNRNVLNGLDKEGYENVDGIGKELMVGYCVDRGEDVNDLGGGTNQSGDIGILKDGVEGSLGLGKEVVDVFTEVGIVFDLLGFVAKFLDLFVGRLEEVRICQELLHGVADVHHKILKLRIRLGVAHDFIELFFELFPMLLVAERADQRPKVTDCPIEFAVGFDIILSSADGLIRGS